MSKRLGVAGIGFLLMLLLALWFFASMWNPEGNPPDMQNSTRPRAEPTMTIEPLN